MCVCVCVREREREREIKPFNMVILNHITLLYYLHVHFASVNLIPYFFFLVYILAYISNSFCTTCLILYIIIITIIILFLSVNTYMHYL